MIERRKHFPGVFQFDHVDIRNHYAGAVWQTVKHLSPWVDDHAVTMCLTTTDVVTTLISGDHE